MMQCRFIFLIHYKIWSLIPNKRCSNILNLTIWKDEFVNMSSIAGVMGIPHIPIYSASKHAVLGLTKSAALEYAKSGIRINAVAPGGVETNMAKRVVEHNYQFLETLTSMHPIGRIADPEEIANAVVWLLSDKASFVLGHTLLIDGGMVSR